MHYDNIFTTVSVWSFMSDQFFQKEYIIKKKHILVFRLAQNIV